MLSVPFEGFVVPGAYGDRRVLIHRSRVEGAERRPLTVLLHGVHGCASPARGNKYGDLARLLAERGFEAAIVESSRSRRDRETFGEDRASWARAAFPGKSFGDETADAISALVALRERFPGRPLAPLGFSLGGLIAILVAGRRAVELATGPGGRISADDLPPFELLGIAGSGEAIRPEAAGSLALPILDRLPDPVILREAALTLDASRVLCFYGERDATFSEEACRGLFDRFPLSPGRKTFLVLDGTDHAFRERQGVRSLDPVRRILREWIPLLGAIPSGGLP
jgi:hypothetical protein